MASKISVYSLSELKSTLDDHIPIYLTSPNLPQSSTPLPKHLRLNETHFLTNVRLALGYSAVAIALYIFYLDYYLKVSWAEHKAITVYAVITYFILNGLLTAWIWFGERGVVFEGSRTGKAKDAAGGPLQLRLSSHAPKQKFEPVYRLGAEWTATTPAGKEQKGKVDAEAPFRLFFQSDGTFVSGEFERWLRKSIPVIAGDGGKEGGKGAGGTEIVASSSSTVGVTPKVVVNSPTDDDDMITVEELEPQTPSQSGRASTPGGTAKKRSKRKG